jgi:prolycopene isomerase
VKKNVVVIGSGVGGSASAALLAKDGYDVTLIESHSFSGGRCASLNKDGFVYDFGVHMFSRGDKGPHGEVNRKLGGNLKWITKDPPCRVMGKMDFDFPLNIKPLSRQIYLARKLGIKFKSLPAIFMLFRSLMKGKDFEKNDTVSLHDYISRYTDDENIHLFINCLCQLYFALSYLESSAGEFIWSFTRMFNDASFGYPKGGGGSIPASFLSDLKKYGGKIKFGETVQAVKIKNGTVEGVQTDKDFYPADIVISNCGISRTIDLAGKNNFPDEYKKSADTYTYSNAYVTIKYALDRPVVPYPVVFYMPDMPPRNIFGYINERKAPEEPYIFMPIPSNIDPGLAPPGKQLVIAGTAAPTGASNELCNKILDKIHERVIELFPEIEKASLWQIRSTASDTTGITKHAAGEAIGIGQTPKQVGKFRPKFDTPVKGLYLVGSDAGARGIGTEVASGSALGLFELLTSGK